jgi:glycosyltransferase involved in cell wall biosynthesis
VVRASVIVPARDAEATLPRTLAALADQEGAPAFEVVVADDGSRDATAAIAERAGARLVRAPAAARNAAVSAASGALLAFCGADCYPTPSWLAAGTRALADADLVQGAVLPDPRAKPGPFDDTRAVTEDSGLYDAGSLFATRALFDRIGGFERPPWADEAAREAAPGREEIWFGWRARRAGARTAFCADALCHRAARRRGVAEYLDGRTTLRELPAAVAQLPELRESLLHRRVFLSRRAMRFDVALAALAAAAVRRSKLPLLAAAPYALELRRDAKGRAGEDWARTAAIDAAADLLGAAALLHGSVEARTPVL